MSTGRRNFSRRPPVVLNEVQIVEKVIEKPVVTVKTVEKIVEVPVPVEVPTVQYVEKPVVKRIYRTKYVRNPIEYIAVASLSLIIGVIIGLLI